MVLCTDCYHYGGGARICRAKSRIVIKTSPFDNKTRRYHEGWEFIDFARSPTGICGPEARLFKPDDTLLQKAGLFFGSILIFVLIATTFFGIVGGAIWLVVKIVKFGMGST